MNHPIAFTFILVGMLFSSVCRAQFTGGSDCIGATIGLSSIGSSVAFGVDYEHGLDVSVGPGIFGIGAQAHYWSYDFAFLGWPSAWSFDYVAISATGAYHVPLDKWDPFVLLSVGYFFVSTSQPEWWGPTYNYNYDSSRLFFGAQVGSRYFLTPNLALQARLGFGAGSLSAGIDWKF